MSWEFSAALWKSPAGPHNRIEVVTTASTIPYEVGDNYLKAFGRIGCTNIGVMHIRNREDALNAEYIERISKCDARDVQRRQPDAPQRTFGGTDFLRYLRQRYLNENFVIAGTSAGAMAMSNTMIYEGNASRAHLKGEVKITTGLGFLENVIVDSILKNVAVSCGLHRQFSNPSCIGIGLGEDTGMLITEGNRMEAIGSGLVIIIDGHDIRHSNIADIPDGNPMSIENLKVHFCEKGNGYMLQERQFLMEAKEGALIRKQVSVE